MRLNINNSKCLENSKCKPFTLVSGNLFIIIRNNPSYKINSWITDAMYNNLSIDILFHHHIYKKMKSNSWLKDIIPTNVMCNYCGANYYLPESRPCESPAWTVICVCTPVVNILVDFGSSKHNQPTSNNQQTDMLNDFVSLVVKGGYAWWLSIIYQILPFS